MSRDFESVAQAPSSQSNGEGVDQSVFNYMRAIVGDRQLSHLQAVQLKQDIEASYPSHLDDGSEEVEMTINLRDEVHQQIRLLRALRTELFFANGAPRPDTEGADIKGYLNSSIQLMNLLQKFDDALKTDKDLRAIERAIEEGFDALSEHPESELAKDFVEVVTKALKGTELGERFATEDEE